MAEKTYAVRAMNAPGFNRAGERFSDKFWRMIEDPDPAILNEPQLIAVDKDARDFHQRIGQIPVQGEEMTPEDENAGLKKKLDKANAKIAELESENKQLKTDAETNLANHRRMVEHFEGSTAELNKQIEELTAPKPIADGTETTDEAESAHLHDEQTGTAPDRTALPVQGASATEDNGAAAKTGAEAAVKPPRNSR